MTAEIEVRSWLAFFEREYLRDFLHQGGAAVKFVVPGDPSARELLEGEVDRRARLAGFVVATVNAAATRIHMMDQLFHRVAEQIPWRDLAREVVVRLARADPMLNVPGVPPPEIGLSQWLGASSGVDGEFVHGELSRALANAVLKRHELSRDFRVAMTQLCRAELAGGEEGRTMSETIIQWLTGVNKSIAAVKPYQIFTRIGRTNARFLFESLLDWLRFAGCSGLVLMLDIERLTVTRNPKDGFVHYTKASRLDAYEVLRQFIDATDRMKGFLLLVVPSRDFLDESPGAPGISEYQALQFRIYDEVRDRELANPMASLVRIGSDARQEVPVG
ncbi:MAG TPA: BREX system ATP-binding domain-containing protein [Vicinamibacterales bacterium]|nr:BREX system ATP-binding domain-containing protein [Vicinamibacterales bacterium]